MNKYTLIRQADRADNIADQTVDEDMKKILHDAANEYREKASHEPVYALFRGNIQLARSFSSEQEAMQAALAEGLIPELQTADESGAQVLPAEYHIEMLEQPYDPQPGWKLPQEIS